MEIWKPIPEYEGYYEASTMGRIRSVDREIAHKRYPGKLVKRKSRVLKVSTLTNGYKAICLHKYGKKSRYKLHRIIAMTFLPNPEHLPHVDHINGLRYDNRPENLRWCTTQQNIEWRDKKFKPGDRPRKNILCKETRMVFRTSYQAADWVATNNLTNSTNWKTVAGNIRDACKFNKRTAYTFHWAYLEGSEAIPKGSRANARNGEPHHAWEKI